MCVSVWGMGRGTGDGGGDGWGRGLGMVVCIQVVQIFFFSHVRHSSPLVMNDVLHIMSHIVIRRLDEISKNADASQAGSVGPRASLTFFRPAPHFFSCARFQEVLPSRCIFSLCITAAINEMPLIPTLPVGAALVGPDLSVISQEVGGLTC